jgi:transcription-repair coupling factor (superfamily II helicase)
MRAIFRAVRNGRQVALLAPTTILAAQHYRTLRKRLPEHMSVELLRGGNTREGRLIKDAMRDGKIDVVVGTHTLLGRKVEFSKLGKRCWIHALLTIVMLTCVHVTSCRRIDAAF